MFAFATAIVLLIFSAEPQVDLAKLQAEMGIPQTELEEYRVHVARRGKWSIRHKSIYNFKGMDRDVVEEFKKGLMECAKSQRAEYNSRYAHSLDHDRWQFDATGKSKNMIDLASLLADYAGGEHCDYVCCDKKSLELRFDFSKAKSDEQQVANDWPWSGERPEHVVYNALAQIVIDLVIDAAAKEALRIQNISEESLEKAIDELQVDWRLILTTDGKITADAPAEVSEDGKTLTLDLWKFMNDPPQKWSLRIDGF